MRSHEMEEILRARITPRVPLACFLTARPINRDAIFVVVYLLGHPAVNSGVVISMSGLDELQNSSIEKMTELLHGRADRAIRELEKM